MLATETLAKVVLTLEDAPFFVLGARAAERHLQETLTSYLAGCSAINDRGVSPNGLSHRRCSEGGERVQRTIPNYVTPAPVLEIDQPSPICYVCCSKVWRLCVLYWDTVDRL